MTISKAQAQENTFMLMLMSILEFKGNVEGGVVDLFGKLQITESQKSQ
jgi:hypothetical protein